MKAESKSPTATLLVTCPDRRGLVATLAEFLHRRNGNIVHADHHTDFATGLFLTRLEWELDGFDLDPEEIAREFESVAREIEARWDLHFSDRRSRVAIWVTREEHCLLELLWRARGDDLPCDVALVIANRPDLEPLAREHGVPFELVRVTRETKAAAEARQLELLRRHDVDLVILARYMQVLSPEFIAAFPDIINIHHSFLPAFPGARPYQRAHERGVKIIGATAHYATAELDDGPIIEQDVVRISHRDTVSDLVRKGRDLERLVLARAVRYHLTRRVLVYGNRTVVFA